jgi:hypothetical protein
MVVVVVTGNVVVVVGWTVVEVVVEDDEVVVVLGGFLVPGVVPGALLAAGLLRSGHATATAADIARTLIRRTRTSTSFDLGSHRHEPPST